VNSGDPVGEFRENWEQLAAQARDEKLFGGGYDRSLLELIEASRETDLGRLFPFTSMNRLCFARSSKWPFQDIQPALVDFHRYGRYIVRSGGPYPADRDPPIALTTADAATAVATVITLLGIDSPGGSHPS
jgi:hypothetical protein